MLCGLAALAALALYSRQVLPYPGAIRNSQLQNARIVSDRSAMLDCIRSNIPMGGHTAEVGILYGLFSEAILRVLQPARHVLIDTITGRAQAAAQSGWTSKICSGGQCAQPDGSATAEQFFIRPGSKSSILEALL